MDFGFVGQQKQPNHIIWIWHFKSFAQFYKTLIQVLILVYEGVTHALKHKQALCSTPSFENVTLQAHLHAKCKRRMHCCMFIIFFIKDSFFL